MKMTNTIESQLLWKDYCETRGIANPYKEQIDSNNNWHKRRKEYDKLQQIFLFWDYHFYMGWAEFQERRKYEHDIDLSMYEPCDYAERQCALTCPYFQNGCCRSEEELKTPQILGFEGKWTYHNDKEYWL